MDVLVEVHDEAELDRALAVPGALLGINNRNLKTLAVDLATFERLAPRVPQGRLLVAESGLLYGMPTLAAMAAAGARAFLVGESLMREPDVTAATRRLLALARMSGLSHIDAAGNAVMVDVTGKDVTQRTATAEGRVTDGAGDPGADRGARVQEGRRAGGGAARRHHGRQAHGRPDPALPSAAADRGHGRARAGAGTGCVVVRATCRVTGRTGVEMEALTAVAVAALTVYDMCKAVDRGMRITDMRLVHKDGGRSGEYRAGA